MKRSEKDLFGEDQDVLYVSGRGADLATIEADGFSPIRLGNLGRLITLEELSDGLLANELTARLTDRSAPVPPIEALLHAILPHKYIDYVHADALLAVTNTPSDLDHIRQIYGSAVVTVPRDVPQSISEITTSCATSTSRRVRYPASAVLRAVSARPFLAPWVEMKYSSAVRPSRKFDLIGDSMISPICPVSFFCGLAISPRIPAS